MKLRTFQEEGLLVFHKFSSSGHLKLLLSAGILRCEVHADNELVVVLEQYDVSVSDGVQHRVQLEINMDSLTLTVDTHVITAPVFTSIRTGPFYLIGGGLHGETGLIGCVEDL